MENDRTWPGRLKGGPWEGDDPCRILAETVSDAIVTIDEDGTILFINPAAEGIFGYALDHLFGSSLTILLPDGLCPLCLGDAGRCVSPGRPRARWVGMELLGLHSSGREIPLEVSFGEFTSGGRRYFTGIIRDISARLRAERRLAAQHAVTRVLAESDSLSQAAPRILRTLCEHLGWELGALWAVEREAGVLRAVEIWHAAGVSAEEFERRSRELSLGPGVGLSGRVWQSGEPVWLVDVLADENFPRVAVAAKAGLRAAFAFPVTLGAQVLGVVELFSREVREPDADLLALVASVGSQTGQFIERERAEGALRRANEELERRVAERTAELFEANVRLKGEIAEREQSEKALRASEERFRRFSEASSEGIVVHSGATILEANSTAARLCGYEPDEAVGMPLLTFAAPEYHETLLRNISNGIETTCEVVAVRKDGSTFPVELTGKNCEYKGRSARLVLFRDITERKQAEESLRQSARDYRMLFEQAHDAICVFTPEGEIVLDVNRRACEMYGFSRAEFVGMSLEAISKDVSRGKLRIAETLEKGDYFNFETVQYRKDGTEMFLEINAAAVNYQGVRAILSINRDVTERKHAEEALRRAEEKYRGIFENAVEGIFQSTPDGRFIDVNPAMARMYGYVSPAEMIAGRTDIARQHYVDSHRREEFRRLIEERGVVRGFESEVYRKDGSTFWTSESVRTVRGAGGEVIYYEGTVEDITARKHAEEAVKASREELSLVMNSVDEIVYRGKFDQGPLDYRLTQINSKTDSLLGYQAGEFVSDPSVWLENIHPDDRPVIVEQMGRLTRGELVTWAYRFRHKHTGEYRWLEDRITPEFNGEGAVVGFFGAARDITERKRAEEERAQLLRRLVAAQEEERRRIALELHDRLGQFSTALMLGLKSLKDSGELPAGSGGRVEGLTDLTDQLGQEIHRLAWELRPSSLDDHGLEAALANYLEEWSTRSGVAVDFHSTGSEDRRLPAEVETVVYRIAQEALTNVVRHAGARHVGVLLERGQRRVRIFIEDDGRGFNVREVLKTPETQRRMGLVGMHERARMVGGVIEIESSDFGTTVFLSIPIEPGEGE
jgi:PAS domain S-box-containing protein